MAASIHAPAGRDPDDRDSSHVRPRNAPPIEPLDIHAIALELAARRGWTLKGPVRGENADESAILRRFETPGPDSSVSPPDALWQVFGLASPGHGPPPTLLSFVATSALGLYDSQASLVWARPEDLDTRSRDWALAHRAEHALQDRAGVIKAFPLDADEALALRSLVEGDAEVAAAASIAKRELWMDHWLVQWLSWEQDPSHTARAFEGAPAFGRRQWTFPYVEGARLVGSIYRAGGYALVNQMFDHPPVSTEQVLHPDKYVAGELPIPVGAPAAPEGCVRLMAGRMGELRTRALLDQCETPADPHLQSLGWGGDAFAVVQDANERLAVLWSTVWDDEPSAERFESAMRSREACMRKHQAPGAALPVGSETTVAREGDRVAYLMGMTADSRTRSVRALLALPGTRPTHKPPLGNVRLRTIVDPQSFMARGEIRNNRYVSEALGLSAAAGAFDTVPAPANAEIALEAYFGISMVRVTLYALLTSSTKELNERIVRRIVGPREENGPPAVPMAEALVSTGSGAGRALRWSRGATRDLAVVIVPVCENKITLVVSASGGGYGVWERVKDWLRSLRFDPESPACLFVKEDSQ